MNLKKTVLSLSGVALLATLIFGGDAWSYLTTATGKVRDAAKSNVSVEFEIDRAKEMVTNLMPEIRKNMDIIAKEEAQLDRLTREIAALESRMEREKSEILTLRNDLQDDALATKFVYSGKSYTRTQVEADLASRFERYQIDETTLESLQKMQEVRSGSLATARQKLQSYLSQKRELEVTLEQLAARLKMVELAKTTSEYNFDEGSLGQAKSLISELQNRLEVEERLVSSSGGLSNGVILDAPSQGKDITERISEHFQPAEKPNVFASNDG